MFTKYPKGVSLKDNRQVILRPMKREDQHLLFEFFRRLKPEERHFLKQDVTDPSFVQRLIKKLDQEYYILLLALAEGKVVGEANLSRHKFGWTRHVGDIRILTDPNYREIGLGTALAKEIFFLAVHLKLQIVTAHMMEDQQGARRVFQRFGFEEEAILKNHVLDLDGQKHNMVIMSQSIPEIWEQIQDIIDESVKIKSGS